MSPPKPQMEHPVCFNCDGETLVGILHRAAAPSETGLVIVVGGPQYRIGSHRHFVELARELSKGGVPVLRFDVRGMGDSSGAFPGFEAIHNDIAAAIDVFVREEPRIKNVVLWGLCDGASASMFYAPHDHRVAGLILLNPWIRSEASYAKTELRHYYGARILDGSFWRRLFSGGVNLGDATRSLFKRLRSATSAIPFPSGAGHCAGKVDSAVPLSARMAQGIASFKGDVLLIVSGNDLTAKEFDDVTQRSVEWKQILSADRMKRHDLEQSDHTFSRSEWSQTVNRWTLEWVNNLGGVARPNLD